MFSRRTINAIELCVLLACSRSNSLLTTEQISASLGLSSSYTENILRRLKINEIVASSRGPGGGYKINGDPSLISIWDVSIVFESTFINYRAGEFESLSCEVELLKLIKITLDSYSLFDFIVPNNLEAASVNKSDGHFKLKPLPLPLMPKAPNSVFQLHMSFK